MSQTIPAELFRTELCNFLTETFEQVQGIYLDRGTSLFETLAGITAAEASRPVSANCAALSAQVKHVTFYLQVIERILQTGENERVDWGEIWRTTREVTPQQWAEIQQELRDTYARVRRLVENLPYGEHPEAVGDSLAMIVHTAYHLGEIRQALCTLKA